MRGSLSHAPPREPTRTAAKISCSPLWRLPAWLASIIIQHCACLSLIDSLLQRVRHISVLETSGIRVESSSHRHFISRYSRISCKSWMNRHRCYWKNLMLSLVKRNLWNLTSETTSCYVLWTSYVVCPLSYIKCDTACLFHNLRSAVCLHFALILPVHTSQSSECGKHLKITVASRVSVCLIKHCSWEFEMQALWVLMWRLHTAVDLLCYRSTSIELYHVSCVRLL